MGANKTYQQKGDRGRILGESDEFRRLRHAIEKAHGNRERAITFVCRLYHVRTLDALPRRDPRRNARAARRIGKRLKPLSNRDNVEVRFSGKCAMGLDAAHRMNQEGEADIAPA